MHKIALQLAAIINTYGGVGGLGGDANSPTIGQAVPHWADLDLPR